MSRRGFSLVEVIVAIGVLALAVVAVIGLLPAVGSSVARASESESAAQVAEAVVTHLRTLRFEEVAVALKTVAEIRSEDGRDDYNPAADRHILCASRAGDRIGWSDDSELWVKGDREKYFEVALVRDESLSPAANDASAAVLVFHVRLRWPLFVPGGLAGATQVGADTGAGRFNHAEKQVLVFPGSVRR